MRVDIRFASALFLAVLGLQTPCFADSTIVFNEIMYHPAASEATLEWVELHSQMGVDMDISGWSIRGGIEFTFPEGTTVEGGGLVVVAIAPVAMAAESGFADALGPFAGRLGNDGDRLELRSNSDRLMDWVEYGDDDDWPPGADGSGVSLAKVDPDTASPPPDNWRTSLETGGTPGRHNFGSPAGPTQVELLPIGAPWKLQCVRSRSGHELVGHGLRRQRVVDRRRPLPSRHRRRLCCLGRQQQPNPVNGNRKPHICGNRKLHTPGEDVSGGADILPVMPVGRVGLDAGSGATGVQPNTRREAAEPAVTLRLPHAVRPTLSSASADAPASGSCCPGC